MITDAWAGAPHRQVHFAPKYGNKIMVNGAIETISPAIAVLSGGIGADVTNACVDKICGQPLAPDMLYRVYVFKDGQKLRINFSPAEHKEGPPLRQNSCRPDMILNLGAIRTKDGTVRRNIQEQDGGAVAAARERELVPDVKCI